jgi:hypothetical protein
MSVTVEPLPEYESVTFGSKFNARSSEMTPDVIAETDVREKPTNVAAHNNEKTGSNRRMEMAIDTGRRAMPKC